MKLNIRHSTIYSYDVPGGQLVQRFHLTPVSGPTQTVIDWSVEAPGMDKALSYTDAFGNVAQLVTSNLDEPDIEVLRKARWKPVTPPAWWAQTPAMCRWARTCLKRRSRWPTPRFVRSGGATTASKACSNCMT
jgi:hypothetical protein